MSVSPVLFSSASGVWSTPLAFFDRLNAEFGFTLDAAANRENRTRPMWFGPGSPWSEDGLAAEWSGVAWLNPPYSRQIGQWVKKAADEAAAGRCTVVVLIPARPDTRWWHAEALRAHEIRFIRGRLKFGGAEAAPFPSAVLVFHPWKRPTAEPRITWDTVAA